MKEFESEAHISAINGLRKVLNSDEVKDLISKIKKLLISTALDWLEKLIIRTTK